MEIVIKDGAEVANAASEKLSELVGVNRKPVMLLLSGGSALGVLEEFDTDLLGPHISIGMLDERISSDANINNYSMLRKTDFFVAAKKAGCILMDSSFENVEDAAEVVQIFAGAYDRHLKWWRSDHSGGRIIILQGIGEDGHTAGVMPYPEERGKFEELFESSRWVVGYDAYGRNKFRNRVTVSNTFLREQVDASVVYAVGSGKKKALGVALANEGELHETPGRIIREMRDVWLFSDVVV